MKVHSLAEDRAPEVRDYAIERIKLEHKAPSAVKQNLRSVENGTCIHYYHQKYIPEVLHIPEEHAYRGKYKSASKAQKKEQKKRWYDLDQIDCREDTHYERNCRKHYQRDQKYYKVKKYS